MTFCLPAVLRPPNSKNICHFYSNASKAREIDSSFFFLWRLGMHWDVTNWIKIYWIKVHYVVTVCVLQLWVIKSESVGKFSEWYIEYWFVTQCFHSELIYWLRALNLNIFCVDRVIPGWRSSILPLRANTTAVYS